MTTPQPGYLIGKAELDGLLNAAEAAVVNAWDINGVQDRCSISYEHLNNLIAALSRASGKPLIPPRRS